MVFELKRSGFRLWGFVRSCAAALVCLCSKSDRATPVRPSGLAQSVWLQQQRIWIKICSASAGFTWQLCVSKSISCRCYVIWPKITEIYISHRISYNMTAFVQFLSRGKQMILSHKTRRIHILWSMNMLTKLGVLYAAKAAKVFIAPTLSFSICVCHADLIHRLSRQTLQNIKLVSTAKPLSFIRPTKPLIVSGLGHLYLDVYTSKYINLVLIYVYQFHIIY